MVNDEHYSSRSQETGQWRKLLATSMDETSSMTTWPVLTRPDVTRPEEIEEKLIME